MSENSQSRNEQIFSLKRNLYKWAKQNLRGTSVKNESTGNVIEISAQGIDEWYSKSKSEEQIKSISLLTEIVKNAKLTHSAKNAHSERKNAPNLDDLKNQTVLNSSAPT